MWYSSEQFSWIFNRFRPLCCFQLLYVQQTVFNWRTIAMFSIIFKSTIQTFLNAIISFSFATILCIKKKKKHWIFIGAALFVLFHSAKPFWDTKPAFTIIRIKLSLSYCTVFVSRLVFLHSSQPACSLPFRPHKILLWIYKNARVVLGLIGRKVKPLTHWLIKHLAHYNPLW